MSENGMLSSVRNAIQIMREFSFDYPELGVTELSERLGISTSSVHRILQTLSEERLIQKNPETRKYRLSLSAFEIGCVFYHEMEVSQIAFPLLQKMMNKIHGVLQLVMYDQGSVVYLLKLPEDRDTRLFNHMGKRVPSHCTASGKALLAFQDDEEIARVCRGPLKAFTERTIVNSIQLQEELASIREKGYATSKEEFKQGMFSLAVPIFDEITGQVLASISITGPPNLFSHRQIQMYLVELRTSSRLISEQFGMRETTKKATYP